MTGAGQTLLAVTFPGSPASLPHRRCAMVAFRAWQRSASRLGFGARQCGPPCRDLSVVLPAAVDCRDEGTPRTPWRNLRTCAGAPRTQCARFGDGGAPAPAEMQGQRLCAFPGAQSSPGGGRVRAREKRRRTWPRLLVVDPSGLTPWQPAALPARASWPHDPLRTQPGLPQVG